MERSSNRGMNNNNRSDRAGARNDQSNNQFTPNISTVESLGTLEGSRKQNFNKFQKSIHHHVMTTYKSSKGMYKCILKFVEPMAEIEKEIKIFSPIRKSKSIYAIISPKSGESYDDQLDREQENEDRRDMVKTISNQHVKSISKEVKSPSKNDCHMGIHHGLLFIIPKRRN